ncbi:MAG TPA: hypothetical protein VMP11_13105 [Verrucomicrobiae bacterium]|nr:hypothetical protein [Verrucomicrobiae bacterium]
MVSKYLACLSLAGFCLSLQSEDAHSQITQIVPWNDTNLTLTSASTIAYHPEPIIFVHGITSSRLNWTNVIQNLAATNNWFGAYHYNQDEVTNAYESTTPPQEGYTASQFGATFVPTPELNQWQPMELPYLHTFNYGRHQYIGPGTNYPWSSTFMLRQSRQSHDPVEWNSWSGYSGTGNDYLNGRVTLDQRITSIRNAYRMPYQITAPNVILIGHSLGGLVVCDYLLNKNANLGSDPYVPVRRAITIDTLLWGSPLANVVANYDNLPHAAHGGMAWTHLVAPMVGAGEGWWPPWDPKWKNAAGTWIENHNGATKYFTVNLQDAMNDGDMPVIHTSGVLFSNASPFQTYLHTAPMPETTEFVTSGAHTTTQPSWLVKVFLGSTNTMVMQDLQTAFNGDGAVPLNSMAGYHANGASVFANISPVDIRGYLNGNTNWLTDHGTAPHMMGIYPHLLDGVQYVSGAHPDGGTNWSGFQKEYADSPYQYTAAGWVAHTDEPGIDYDYLTLLSNRDGENPLVIPTFSTWDWTWSDSDPLWQKQPVTNEDEFVWSQVIGGNNPGGVRYVGRVGVKNQSTSSVTTSGTNYWVLSGNEYLPASLYLQASNDVSSIPVAANASALPGATQIVNQCLVQLDTNDVPQYQYGMFDIVTAGSVVTATNNFVAVQGYNVAHLMTPQAELAFNVPVDSETAVSICKEINNAEAATNMCPPRDYITQWTSEIREWVATPTNGIFTLNFYPTSIPIGTIYDPWTWDVYSNWTYAEANKTITLADPENAPSSLLVSYYAYLGCSNSFTTNYSDGTSFTVPALTNDSLTGVTVDEGLVDQMRASLEGVLFEYKDTTSSNCVSWTLPSILAAAGNSTSNWTPVVNGLVLPQHFTELKAVADLLTMQLGTAASGCPSTCNSCDEAWPESSNVTISISGLSYNNTSTTNVNQNLVGTAYTMNWQPFGAQISGVWSNIPNLNGHIWQAQIGYWVDQDYSYGYDYGPITNQIYVLWGCVDCYGAGESSSNAEAIVYHTSLGEGTYYMFSASVTQSVGSVSPLCGAGTWFTSTGDWCATNAASWFADIQYETSVISTRGTGGVFCVKHQM